MTTPYKRGFAAYLNKDHVNPYTKANQFNEFADWYKGWTDAKSTSNIVLNTEVEKYVAQYGDVYRAMITNAIEYKNKITKDISLKDFDVDAYTDILVDGMVKNGFWENT